MKRPFIVKIKDFTVLSILIIIVMFITGYFGNGSLNPNDWKYSNQLWISITYTAFEAIAFLYSFSDDDGSTRSNKY